MYKSTARLQQTHNFLMQSKGETFVTQQRNRLNNILYTMVHVMLKQHLQNTLIFGKRGNQFQ